MDQWLKDYDSSEAQYGVLRNIPDDGSVTASELSRVILRGKSNLTTLLARMERDGFVMKETDSQDGRRTRVTLTEHGTEAQERLVPLHYGFIEEVFSCFTKEETEQLLALLSRLYQRVQEQAAGQGHQMDHPETHLASPIQAGGPGVADGGRGGV